MKTSVDTLGELLSMALQEEYKPTRIEISYGGDHIDVMIVRFPAPSFFKVTANGIEGVEPWKFAAIATEVKYQYEPLTGNTPRIEQV